MPGNVSFPQLRWITEAEQYCQAPPVNDLVLLAECSNFMKSAMAPVTGVRDLIRSYHVPVDIHHAARKMDSAFNRGSVVAILPEWSRSGISYIEFLSHSTCDKLHSLRDFAQASVFDEQMDVI